jgi:signal peptidase I
MEITRRQKILSVIVVVFIITVLMRLFVFEGFVVKGDSMEPTIHSGDFVFINRLAYLRHEPKRGDIIVAVPRAMNIKVIKRVVGLPGERFSIEKGKVVLRSERTDPGDILQEIYLNTPDTPGVGITYTNIDPKEYFALGDNRAVSIDSRELGPIDLWDIKGKVIGTFSLKAFSYKGL